MTPWSKRKTAGWLLLLSLGVVVLGCEKTECDMTVETLQTIKTAGFCEGFTPKNYTSECIDSMTLAEGDLFSAEEQRYVEQCR